MPLFTSSSDGSDRDRRPDGFTILLLSTILLSFVGVEWITRERFDASSRVQRQERYQHAALIAVRDIGGLERDPHIAVLGNSLMLEGIDLPLFRAHLKPGYVPVPYFVLGTNYYDWLFGLHRLFDEGMRPKYVLLGLSPNQLATSEVRGDITARYMVEASDLPRIVKLTQMDATRASEFILAHFSEFYSTREVTRGYVMSRLLPTVGGMFHIQYAGVRDPRIVNSVLSSIAADRLAALNELCRANGARLLFVVPPSYQQGADAIRAAGSARGVTVLVPVEDDEFDSTDYQSDGVHMNKKGAEIFSSRLAASLNKELPE